MRTCGCPVPSAVRLRPLGSADELMDLGKRGLREPDQGRVWQVRGGYFEQPGGDIPRQADVVTMRPRTSSSNFGRPVGTASMTTVGRVDQVAGVSICQRVEGPLAATPNGSAAWPTTSSATPHRKWISRDERHALPTANRLLLAVQSVPDGHCPNAATVTRPAPESVVARLPAWGHLPPLAHMFRLTRQTQIPVIAGRGPVCHIRIAETPRSRSGRTSRQRFYVPCIP